MSIAVIINPKSGGASLSRVRARAELASAVLSSGNVSGEVFVTERRGHAQALTAAAVARGARLVVAWGGDGTINEVASALLSSPASLGIIPAGSGNGLARELGVATQPERALLDAIAATPRLIDAGELGGRIFVNIAGVGFDAHVAACFDRDKSSRRGLITYARITARELASYRCGTFRVDGQREPQALLVTIANTSQFGNGARIAPDARVDDGELDLVVVRERNRLATLTALPRMFLGGLEKVPGVTRRRVTDVTIESDVPMVAHVDGEPMEGGTRLVARVLPAVLRVALR